MTKTTPEQQHSNQMKNKRKRRSFKEFRRTIVDIYEFYPNKDKVDKKTFKEVLYAFNYILSKSIIDTGYIYQLPQQMGLLYINKSKVKTKKFNMDFQHWKETGERIEFKNKHSHGFIASFQWFKRKPYLNVKVPTRATFTPVRQFKRYLAKCIKEYNVIHNYIDFHYAQLR